MENDGKGLQQTDLFGKKKKMGYYCVF